MPDMKTDLTSLDDNDLQEYAWELGRQTVVLKDRRREVQAEMDRRDSNTRFNKMLEGLGPEELARLAEVAQTQTIAPPGVAEPLMPGLPGDDENGS